MISSTAVLKFPGGAYRPTKNQFNKSIISPFSISVFLHFCKILLILVKKTNKKLQKNARFYIYFLFHSFILSQNFEIDILINKSINDLYSYKFKSSINTLDSVISSSSSTITLMV